MFGKLKKALELRKAKYTKRTGSPGNYKYQYGSGGSGRPLKQDGTGPHGRGIGPGKGRADGSGVNDAELKRHPNYSASDLQALRDKGYSLKEVRKIWDRDIARGSRSPGERKNFPDAVSVAGGGTHPYALSGEGSRMKQDLDHSGVDTSKMNETRIKAAHANMKANKAKRISVSKMTTISSDNVESVFKEFISSDSGKQALLDLKSSKKEGWGLEKDPAGFLADQTWNWITNETSFNGEEDESFNPALKNHIEKNYRVVK